MRADTDFEEYVRPRLPGWRRVAYLMAGDWDRGDDAVQRMLTDLFRTWSRARKADNLDGLAHTMLTRRLLDERRLRWSGVRLSADIADRPAPDGSGQDSTDNRAELLPALRMLGPRQRAVIVLRYFRDLTVEETAVILGCSEGTVKSQTARALATLRQHLAPLLEDPLLEDPLMEDPLLEDPLLEERS